MKKYFSLYVNGYKIDCQVIILHFGNGFLLYFIEIIWQAVLI